MNVRQMQNKIQSNVQIKSQKHKTLSILLIYTTDLNNKDLKLIILLTKKVVYLDCVLLVLEPNCIQRMLPIRQLCMRNTSPNQRKRFPSILTICHPSEIHLTANLSTKFYYQILINGILTMMFNIKSRICSLTLLSI